MALLIVAFTATYRAPIGAQEHRHDNEAALERLFAALAVQSGSVVADVGAGDGAYTVPLARAVGGTGRVISVDISPRALERLRARVAREGVANVEVIQGEVDNPKLPAGSLDAVLIVNAYHEMTQYHAMLAHIRTALKTTGRLVIADFSSATRRAEPRDRQTNRHEIAPELVLQEVRAAGFRIVGLEDPFTGGHGHADHAEWLLTLVPAGTLASASMAPAASTSTAAVLPFDPADVRAPDLRITFDDFMRLYREDRVIVLDVRDPAMFARGRIPKARLAPMHVLRDLLPALTGSTRQVVTYCDCPAEEASARAAVYLRQRGVKNVRALLGGWEAWGKSGNAVEK